MGNAVVVGILAALFVRAGRLVTCRTVIIRSVYECFDADLSIAGEF